MKTRNLILFAAAILAASCVKDMDPVENSRPVSESAVLVLMEFMAPLAKKDFSAHMNYFVQYIRRYYSERLSF